MALKYFNGGSATGSYSWAGNYWYTGSGQSGSTTGPAAGDCVVLESNVSTLGGCKPVLTYICNNLACGAKTLCIDSSCLNLCGAGTSCFTPGSIISLSASKLCIICTTTSMILSGSTLSAIAAGSNGLYNAGIFCAFNSCLTNNHTLSTNTGGITYFDNTTAQNMIGICGAGTGSTCFLNNSVINTPICAATTSPTIFCNSTNYGSITASCVCFCSGSINCGNVACLSLFDNSTNCGNLSCLSNGSSTTCTVFQNNAKNSGNVCATCRTVFCSNSCNLSTVCGFGTGITILFGNGQNPDATCNGNTGNLIGNGCVCFNGCSTLNCGNISNSFTCVAFCSKPSGPANYGTICSLAIFCVGDNAGLICNNVNFCGTFGQTNNCGGIIGNVCFGSSTSTNIVSNMGTVTGTACFYSSANTGSGAYNCYKNYYCNPSNPSTTPACVYGNTFFCCCYSGNSGVVGSLNGSNSACFICTIYSAGAAGNTSTGLVCGCAYFTLNCATAGYCAYNSGNICGNALFSCYLVFNSGIVTGNACFCGILPNSLQSYNVSNGNLGNGALICGDMYLLGYTGPSFTQASTFTNCCFDIRTCGCYRDSAGNLFTNFCTNNGSITITGTTLLNKLQFNNIVICSNDIINNTNVSTPNATICLLCCSTNAGLGAIINNSSISAKCICVQTGSSVTNSSLSSNISFYSCSVAGTTCDWSNSTKAGINVNSFVYPNYYNGNICLLMSGPSIKNNYLLTNGYFSASSNSCLLLNVNGYICSPTTILNSLSVNCNGDAYGYHSPNNSISSVFFNNSTVNYANINCYCLPNNTYTPISSYFLGSSQNRGTVYNGIFCNNTNQGQYLTGCVLSALQYVGLSSVNNRTFTVTGTNYFGVSVGLGGCIFDNNMNTLTSFAFCDNSSNCGVIPLSACFLCSSQNYGIVCNATFYNNTNQGQYLTGCVLSALQYVGLSSVNNRTFTVTGTNYFGVSVNGCVFDNNMSPLTAFVFCNNSYNRGIIPNKSYFCNTSYNTGTISNSGIFCQNSYNIGTVTNVVFNQCSYNGSNGKYNNLIAYNSLQKGINSTNILAPDIATNY